ncbi:zinc finger protein, putative [Bodo saltans]|uniref:ubiquitinyl hydrolase 1 n=1 Tax=Bodo saltans TaxID=75058 RepID=A0A0S4JJE2_BODSA|nr:zinc finger protein, putative [Bodo saltans]|eukprot:CUG89319.1 zinc finger protein, putative [Bodo saltans]
MAVPSVVTAGGSNDSSDDESPSSFHSSVYHQPFPDSAATLRNVSSIPPSITGTNSDCQLMALKLVYYLQLSYCTAWQAVETPARSYDSERCLVAVSMLLAYDALARNTQNAKECFLLAFLLNDDGGCFLSTTLCKANRPYEEISSRLELTKPHLACVRDAQIAYIRHQHRTLRRELFDLRQTDKLELRKHSYTVDFMRRFLENCGYEIFSRANDQSVAMAMNINQSEMEKLMMWFCVPRAPVAREHPEFTMLRDVTLLTKFLGTMELRDAQLLRKKKELDEFATWRLSFEEDTPGRQMSAGWRTRPDPPRWESLMVRGRDMDIADIVVKGFGDRELGFGDGLVLQSPIDVGAQINVDDPTEDDILHTANLPTFGGTLTTEESEMLLSMLTTPYLRIPMVLNFFANSDRHSYLLHEDLQKVLRATLFEPGVHHNAHMTDLASTMGSPSTSAASSPFPTEIPLRLTRQQKSEVQIAVIRGDTTKKDHTALLGTSCGLLLNELAYSPSSVFRPLHQLVKTIAALGQCSVYSVNASYTLYLLNVCSDVLAYGLFALQAQHHHPTPSSSTASAASTEGPLSASTTLPQLREPAEVERSMAELQASLDEIIGNNLMPQWFAEAEDNDDTPTLCVLESYMAAFTKVKLAALTWERRRSEAGGGGHHAALADSRIQTSLMSLLASCTYVRARHGFGMGMQRTQLAAQSNEALLTPEEKLLRFLQAQGLDTSRVTKDMLEHGRRLMNSGGKRRAVFVQIRSRYYNDTVRVPNLFRVEAMGNGGSADAKRMKLPPLDVPEHLIFSILLEEHKSLSTLLRSALVMDAPEIGIEGRRRVHLDRIMNTVVQRVLRERKTAGSNGAPPAQLLSLGGAASDQKGRDDAWDVSVAKSTAAAAAAAPTQPSQAPPPVASTGGLVFSAPASGLTFHLQTCELFWRNDELKPVPDSMSHYTDYETILGKDVMQCGLVRRSLHRHWIHIVGTPYDVVEWDTTDPEDQGVHQPRILMGPPTSEDVEQVKYDGVLFDRLVNIDDETPWPVSEERWAIDLVKRVLKEAFPNPGEMKYKPLVMSSEDIASQSQQGIHNNLRLIMNDKPQYEKEEERNTWKEIVVANDPRQLLIFNLVPHARGTYRSLVFCTDQRLALHSLALLRRPRDANSLLYLQYQAGELKRRVQNEGSLEIWRFNAQIRGREVFTPARLLQGVVPSALLESFLFWHGEDDVIRGYPMSEDDDPLTTAGGGSDANVAAAASRQATLQHWFRYAVEVRFVPSVGSEETAVRHTKRCVITRRNDMSYTTAGLQDHEDTNKSPQRNTMVRQQSEVAVDAASGMRRSVSFDDNKNSMGSPMVSGLEGGSTSFSIDAATVAMLRTVYPSLPLRVLKYALRSTQSNISDAIEWISAPENESTITALVQGGGDANHVNSPTVAARRGSANSPLLGGSQRSRSRTLDFDNAASSSVTDTAAAVCAAVVGDDAGELDDVSPIRERSMTSLPRVGGNQEGEHQSQRAAVAAGTHQLQQHTVEMRNPVWRLLHFGEVSAFHPLRPLFDVLIKVEDASHILVWGVDDHITSTDDVGNVMKNEEEQSNAAASSFQIHLIELPRLRAKFQPKLISEGTHSTTRLLLLDHPGWMLATSADLIQQQQHQQEGANKKTSSRGTVDIRKKSLEQLAAPFPQHMILRNVSEEFALFVPNHDFAKLIVQDNPYATELLFDRSSLQWQESVPSPFYLYNVHASGAFVVAPSLGASLYLAALSCMHRMYEVALRTLESCYVDTDFTVEEAYMCALMQRSLDRNAPDLHPDAHAVRIKLAHAVMYSDNKLQWPLHTELESYLAKARHVSANCRLQRDELLDLMKRCGRAPPLLKSQLQLWVPFLQRARNNNDESTTTAPIRVTTQPHLLRMGQPWDKLLTMSFDSISRSTISRIHFNTPKQPLVGEQLVKLLWEDEMIADEESGANRQLGFFFLYQLKRGRIPATLSGNANSGVVEGKNVAGSLAQILTRYFHLRHSRWGKEAQEAGESEAVPSFAMCVLGVMDSFPAAGWPDMTDRLTLDAMSRGTSTNAPTASELSLADDRNMSLLGGRGGRGGGGGDRRTKLPDMICSLERLLRTLYGTTMPRIQANRRELQRAHQRFLDAQSLVQMWAHIIPRVLPSNTASSSVSVRGGDVFQHQQHGGNNMHDLEFMSTIPLNAIGLFSPSSATHATSNNEEGALHGPDAPNAFIFASSSKPVGETATPSPSVAPLPFDVSAHPWAANHISKDMLERLGQDAQRYADMQRETVAYSLTTFQSEAVKGLVEWLSSSSSQTKPTTTALSSLTAVEAMKETVTRLVHALMNLNRIDESAIHFHRQEMLTIANRSEKKQQSPAQPQSQRTNTSTSLRKKKKHRVADVVQQSPSVRNECVGRCPCTVGIHNSSPTPSRAVSRIINSPRYLLVDDSIVLANLRRHGVDWSTQPTASQEERARGIAEAIGSRVSTLVRALLDLLTAQRYHAEKKEKQPTDDEGSHTTTSMEPRFLLFEFLFSFLLRKRQVEMVRWFVSNVSEHGISRVQQMLMGQGKTTVVGPLLALILADGEQLVTQVMPTALLEQSRTVLRRCFSTIVPKRILSLQFDRSTEDNANVAEALFQKLDSARRMRAVVVSAPECVKALFLKYVEELHVIETIGNNDLDATTNNTAASIHDDEENNNKTTDTRRGREVKLLRDKTIARSNMADALVPILDLWRNGVMMMDEVDVLLHPLRSELNFPIGLKYPIDMSGARWNLPMHLLSAVFSTNPIGAEEEGDMATTSERQKTSLLYGVAHLEATYAATELSFVSTTLQSTHQQLQAVIQRGLHTKALQREPHMVLLDLEFYRTDMLPLLVQWISLWLQGSIESERRYRKKITMANATTTTTTATAALVDTTTSQATEFDAFVSSVSLFLTTSASKNLSVFKDVLEAKFAPKEMQLLFLARDWLTTILPHVLSKIDRVGFGMLQSADTPVASSSSSPPSSLPPLSRRLMAIPFVAKDVPSRSSEFAHPDVVLGLTVLAYRYEGASTIRYVLEAKFAPKEMQLLFLARDWLTTILPHVLSKIDRVGFGMLQSADTPVASSSSSPPSSLPPLSRRLMAIPFVAKDVPSRIAHPDVVLGLTVLAYRYEGLRLSDTKELLRQLKHDYSRQVGASEQRPASRLYASWLHAAAAVSSSSTSTSRIPLSQLQIQDPAHLHALHNTFKRVPSVLYYYLSHHVFPRTMNFQQLKISACGHELGSSLLFQKRIGFSGTPSNLLPLDLGECCYEPGSDGHMLSVLTNPSVTTCELLPDDWSPLSLLRRIATANPPFHSLIDTGALITNMDNEQVARYLLEFLPPAQFEGVVFLDSSDRQVVLLRSSEMIVPIAQCGIPLSRRFTFFDQVHTTGMDIKQMPTATAVVTLGKDLVFRDYAQGSYRMRGIGKGQRLRVYVIPEVHVRLADVLGPSRRTGRLEVDVPAWLILNAMRLEGLQFVKLCQQELLNIWRKRALQVLLSPPTTTSASTTALTSISILTAYEAWTKDTSDFVRCRRFTALGASKVSSDPVKASDHVRLMRGAIKEFREEIAFPIPDSITTPISFQQKIEDHLKSKLEALLDVPVHEPEISPPGLQALADRNNAAVCTGRQDATRRVTLVLSRMTSTSSSHSNSHDDDDPETAVGLNAEVVHEQEAEEEQEQEAEQEEQRVSHFSRDDEQHIPWTMLSVLSDARSVDKIATRLAPVANSPFFQCNGLQLRPEQAMLEVDPTYLVSDNFFRATWKGSGERRLKNCMLFAHWLVVGSSPPTSEDQNSGRRFVSGLVTLAEGESLRWYVHHSKELNATVAVSLCMVNQTVAAPPAHASTAASSSSGSIAFLDATDLMQTVVVAGSSTVEPTDAGSTVATVTTTVHSSAAASVVFFRYLNNDMFYSQIELKLLREALKATPADVRLGVFLDMLRGRRRPNNEWQDTPIAAVFVENDAQHAALMARSVLRRFEEFIRKLPHAKRESIAATWREGVLRSAGSNNAGMALSASIGVDDAIIALHSALQTTAGGEGSRNAVSGGRHSNITAAGLEEFTAAIRYALSSNSKKRAASVTPPPAVVTENEETSSPAGEVPPPASMTLSEWAAAIAPPLFLPTQGTHQLFRCPTCHIRSIVARRNTLESEAPPLCPHCTPTTHGGSSEEPSSLHDEHEAAGVEEEEDDHWQCSVCTLINAPHCPMCIVCGTPSPIPPSKSAQKKKLVDPAVSLGPWACSVCTLVNEPSLPMCGACGTPNPNALATSSASGGGAGSSGDGVGGNWDCPEGHWTCSVEQGGCSKYNPNSAFYCQVCDRARPNLASLRF